MSTDQDGGLKIYFSYSWTNTAYRQIIGDELKKTYSLTVEFDRVLKQHRSVPEIIKEIVDNADILIVLLSENSIKSIGVLEELVRCNERRTPIISVVIKDEELDLERITHLYGNKVTIECDQSRPSECCREIVKLIEEISADLWLRKRTKVFSNALRSLDQIDTQPEYLRQIASDIIEDLNTELEQLSKWNYSRDISIENNYIRRAIHLFSAANQLYAISIASVSTFWTDPTSRAAAKLYVEKQKGRNAFRLFVFESAFELNQYKNILTFNHDCYGESGGVFVCSAVTYQKLISQWKRTLGALRRLPVNSDFGFLELPGRAGQNSWLLPILDKDFLTFEEISGPQNVHRLNTVTSFFQEWKQLQLGTATTDIRILRWDPTFSVQSEDGWKKLGHAMDAIFDATPRQVRHLVLFKNFNQQQSNDAQAMIWELQHHENHRNDNSINVGLNCWVGRFIRSNATHGNTLHRLKVCEDFSHVLEVEFQSENELVAYYQNEKHKNVREALYRGILPEVGIEIDEFNESDGKSTQSTGLWDKVESRVEKILVRLDFVNEIPYKTLAQAEGIRFPG